MLSAFRPLLGIPEDYRVSHLPIDEIGLRFESTTVGLHVPNCELFAGRSRYRERASRPRLSPYEPPAHRVGGSSTLSRAVPSLQQRTAKTPPIFDAVPLQRQDRTWLFRQSIGQAPPGQQTPPRSVERDGCGRRRGLSFTSALALTPPDFCFG